MRLRALQVAAPGLLALITWAATAHGLDAPWLLLGTHLRADDTAQVFLVLAAVAWTVAALAAGPMLRDPTVPTRRLLVYASVALVGNMGVAVAQDAASFFAFFSMMSIAAYGLVAARSGATGLRAGRIYIGMAIVAEAALLAGFAMAVRAAGDLDLDAVRAGLAGGDGRGWTIGLLLAGLGVKAGVLGLHMWLPLAYAAGPRPAGAVLAGALTELGLLGWLRVLPLGQAEMPVAGTVLVCVGMAAVAYGALVGATQRSAAAVLAYSSIGQIGLMVAGIGVALARPDLAPAAVAAVLLFALHHGIVKGTLFIALGVAVAAAGRARIAAFAALVLLALMLAGAPLTSGAVAKSALKAPAAEWWQGMDLALAGSVVATTILMGRMLFVTADVADAREPLPGRMPAAAVALGIAAAAGVVIGAGRWGPLSGIDADHALAPGAAWTALWPIAAGAGIAWALDRLTAVRAGGRPPIPTGDVVVAAELVGDRLQAVHRYVSDAGEGLFDRARVAAARLDLAPLARLAAGAEGRMAPLAAGATALVIVVIVLLALTAGAGR